MPERGSVYRLVHEVDVDSGEAVDPGPAWIPYISSDERVRVPEMMRDLGAEVRTLPTVKAYGSDLICEQYAYLATRRLETDRKSYVLGDGDSLAVVQSQVGGVPVLAVTVMRLVGDPLDTVLGPAYETVPCFRFRIPVDEDGGSTPPVQNAIGWLVHHPSDRAARVDCDWEHLETRDAWRSRPSIEVRIDQAVTGSGEAIYAAVLELPDPVAGVGAWPVSPGSTAVTGSDVLPASAPKRRRLFGRG